MYFNSIAAFCWTLHYAKRLLETIFVHRFSHATMPIFNIFKVCMYNLYTPCTYTYKVNLLLVGMPLCRNAVEHCKAQSKCNVISFLKWSLQQDVCVSNQSQSSPYNEMKNVIKLQPVVYFCKHFPRLLAFSLMRTDYHYRVYAQASHHSRGIVASVPCIHGRTSGGKYLQRWTIHR